MYQVIKCLRCWPQSGISTCSLRKGKYGPDACDVFRKCSHKASTEEMVIYTDRVLPLQADPHTSPLTLPSRQASLCLQLFIMTGSTHTESMVLNQKAPQTSGPRQLEDCGMFLEMENRKWTLLESSPELKCRRLQVRKFSSQLLSVDACKPRCQQRTRVTVVPTSQNDSKE